MAQAAEADGEIGAQAMTTTTRDMDGQHRKKISRYIDVEAITEPPLPKNAVRIKSFGPEEIFVSAADGARIDEFIRNKGKLKVNACGLGFGNWLRVSLHDED
jgi:hypothetical protein